MFAAFSAVCIAGCPWTSKNAEDAGHPPSDAAPLEGISLKLLVADDAGLAAAAEQVRGEWRAQTGSQFMVEATAQRDLEIAKAIDADAVICPSYMVGDLAERGLIAKLPESAAGESNDQWQDIFELERLREAAWGDSIVAAPFGSPVLVCYCRTDILEHLHTGPPQTWSEYLRLAELLSDRKKLGKPAPPAGEPWHGTIEPLAPGWAGLTLLARAAPLAKHPDNYSTLFDIKTMRPLIDGPPFVRALEELVLAAELSRKAGLAHSPDSAREAFWQGRCGLAVTWATAADVSAKETSDEEKTPSPARPQLPCTPIELPGAREVYNIDEMRWNTRQKEDDGRVTLLAASGRMGVVSRSSSQPRAAAQLLLWLSGNELKPPPATRSPRTTLYRKSQLQFPRQWVEANMSLDSAQMYCDAVQQAFAREEWLFALRIPGRSEYLAVLDEAVRQAAGEGKSPQKALRETAEKWREITDRLGKERQLRAYRKSLGLEP